jgi:hypothetical protein
MSCWLSLAALGIRAGAVVLAGVSVAAGLIGLGVPANGPPTG